MPSDQLFHADVGEFFENRLNNYISFFITTSKDIRDFRKANIDAIPIFFLERKLMKLSFAMDFSPSLRGNHLVLSFLGIPQKFEFVV